MILRQLSLSVQVLTFASVFFHKLQTEPRIYHVGESALGLCWSNVLKKTLLIVRVLKALHFCYF